MNWVSERRWLILLVLAAGLVSVFVLRAGNGFPLDDSWIHQAYGRNLGLRGEWALIPGQPSAASTAPMYTVLLGIGYGLRVPYILWTHALGTVALWLIGWCGAAITDRMEPKARWMGLVVGILLILTWQLIWAAGSGMETALFAMWTLLIPLLVWRERDAERSDVGRHVIVRGMVFGGVSALAVLTRPEGLGIAGLAGLGMLALRPGGWRRFAWWTAGAAVGFAVLITPYIVLNLQLAGSLLPNTSAAKQAQHAPLLALSYPLRLWEMTQPLLIGGQLLLLPGVVVFVWRGWRDPLRLVLVGWVILLVAVYAARLPASYQHGRYVMPALPALVLVGGVGALNVMRRVRHNRLGRVSVRAWVGSAVGVFVLMALVLGPSTFARDVAVINEEMVAVAGWIDGHLTDEDVLAIHDIGAVAYFAPRPLIDIAGLVTPEVIPIVGDGDALWAYIEAQQADYLVGFPDQLPGDDAGDPRLCPVFESEGTTSASIDGPKMVVYALAWDEVCP